MGIIVGGPLLGVAGAGFCEVYHGFLHESLGDRNALLATQDAGCYVGGEQGKEEVDECGVGVWQGFGAGEGVVVVDAGGVVGGCVYGDECAVGVGPPGYAVVAGVCELDDGEGIGRVVVGEEGAACAGGAGCECGDRAGEGPGVDGRCVGKGEFPMLLYGGMGCGFFYVVTLAQFVERKGYGCGFIHFRCILPEMGVGGEVGCSQSSVWYLLVTCRICSQRSLPRGVSL